MKPEFTYTCCFCGKKKTGYGNSCWPIYPDGPEHRCCDNCNKYVVVHERKRQVAEKTEAMRIML